MEFQTKKAMIWQTDRTSWPYRWNFVCFDSVLSARMMKGCAPDHAQVWAAQRKRACENQVKKVTCLLGNGGRKIIWKPVTKKRRVISQRWEYYLCGSAKGGCGECGGGRTHAPGHIVFSIEKMRGKEFGLWSIIGYSNLRFRIIRWLLFLLA